ncbi:hypothetical protein HNV10_10725 [Winogradskyella litoriviva]|uniref:Uncharacterized protein n=1 Tax=Winogradskyella litoriviva TaxID=1220182 RepID=A0ABX2E5N0_9FLAO|nr:hypothetical protein [Winogradskyella litoriviva]NRD23718.1 hypothetical protein [Winogradskyella litoriviva]
MKSNLFILVFGFLILGCSSDDSNNTTSDGNYFPIVLDNTWNYSVENTSESNPELNFSATDVVTINSVTDNMFTMEVNNGTTPANGTMNTFFSSGTFTKLNSTLVYNGDLEILSETDALPIPDINLYNFTLYDTNANSNTQLYSDTNSFTEDVDFNGQILPITTTYQITNTHLNNLSSLTVNETTYTNIIQTEIKVNLEVSTEIDLGFPISQSILDAQDILVINNYYAEDIGLIKSDANQSFQLNAAFISLITTFGGTLDFPTNSSVDNIQELESYSIN